MMVTVMLNAPLKYNIMCYIFMMREEQHHLVIKIYNSHILFLKGVEASMVHDGDRKTKTDCYIDP